MKGEAGAERARVCWKGKLWKEEEDLREDFKGLPFERRIGVEEVLCTGGHGGEGKGEERGNGIARSRFSLRAGMWSSSSSESGVVVLLEEDSSSSLRK